MTILTLYWIVASIFLQVAFNVDLAETRDPDDTNYQHYKVVIFTNILVMLTAIVLLPIVLGIHFHEMSVINDEQLNAIKEKKKRLFKDDI
jgi:hypothetical protein